MPCAKKRGDAPLFDPQKVKKRDAPLVHPFRAFMDAQGALYDDVTGQYMPNVIRKFTVFLLGNAPQVRFQRRRHVHLDIVITLRHG